MADQAHTARRKIKRIVFETLHKWNGKEEVLMSFSQIKQIAGRAGRFGQHNAGSEGGVTTLNEQDLPLLRQILPSPLTPVPRAVVEPGYDRLAQLALLLPNEASYAELLETYESLVHMSPACMPAAVLPHIKLSELLKGFTKDLTLKEMVTFGYAPVNLRDNKVVTAFQNFVKAYIDEGEVLLEDALESGRLIPNLELVELTRKSMHDLSTSQLRAGVTPAPIPAAIVTAIPGLESLHKALVLYLWLSFRLPLNFPERTEATELKLRTEAMLDFCLERLPGLKKKRGIKHKRGGQSIMDDELQAMPRSDTRKLEWMPREKLDAMRMKHQYGNLDVLPDNRL
jgi:ATP-dependent RNA helicase SUPV3L1/SUV3